MIIATVEATDRKTGTHEYEINLLHEFGIVSEEFRSDPSAMKRKIAALYIESAEHDVLFSDYTKGDPGAFISMFMNPRSVWLEIVRKTDGKIVGCAYMTDVILHYDADAHFTVWDGVGSGREPVFVEMMKWAIDRYHLKRLSCEVPVSHSGTLRMVKRLGFVEEGTRRDAVLHSSGEWLDATMFGILYEEVNHGRWNKEWKPVGNSGTNSASSE